MVVAVLAALARTGELAPSEVTRAIRRFDIDPDLPEPYGA